jgi:hypothetical protein
MDVQFPAPYIVSTFGLYRYYVIIDTFNFYNRHARVEVEDLLKAYVTEKYIPVRH